MNFWRKFAPTLRILPFLKEVLQANLFSVSISRKNCNISQKIVTVKCAKYLTVAKYSDIRFWISTRCGNCGNLLPPLPHFFGKNFVKPTLILKKLLNCSWIDLRVSFSLKLSAQCGKTKNLLPLKNISSNQLPI